MIQKASGKTIMTGEEGGKMTNLSKCPDDRQELWREMSNNWTQNKPMPRLHKLKHL